MQLPYATLQKPFAGGVIRARPEDFVVEEIPAYEFSGKGDHVFFLLGKKNLTTFDAIERVAGALGRKARDIGTAGLKDKNAVTRQWMSLEHVCEDDIRSLSIPGITIGEITRHGNKLKKGHLIGNRFNILISEITGLDEGALEECLDEIHRRGMPNYFGPQRLGESGNNVSRGKDIVLEKWRGPSSKNKRKMLISAYRSHLFNQVLKERIETYDRFLPGDLAFIHGKGAVFSVEDPTDLEKRRASFEISPSGPEYGHGGIAPTGEMGKIECEIIEAENIPVNAWKKLKMKASRRPLRVKVENLSWKKVDRGVELSFALPRGSFATSLLREVIK
ncbi:MAG: tRNA pseudouridine(13) synthase TruD [Planctomycetota bacterium]|nr:MAG: tRNA pseudouridine(13) synthase TruD [Planctomycetota bacterium]